MGQNGAALRILTKVLTDTTQSLGVAGALTMLSSLPITNLQKPTERGRTARTNAAGTWSIQVVFTAQQTANMVALMRTNFTSAATARVRTYSDAAFTVNTYDSGTGTAIIQTGTDTSIDVVSDSDFANLRNVVAWFPKRTDVRAVQIDIADAANPAGYLEATRLMGGFAYEVQYSPAFGGVDFQFMDASKQGRSDDGTMLVEKKYKARKLKIDLSLITDTDLPTLLASARYVGVDKEFFISLYPQWGGAKELYNQAAVRLTDSPTFNPYQYGLHKNSMSFEET